mgnify:CR=1 FL=1
MNAPLTPRTIKRLRGPWTVPQAGETRDDDGTVIPVPDTGASSSTAPAGMIAGYIGPNPPAGFPFSVGENDKKDDESEETAKTAEEAETEEEEAAPADQDPAHIERCRRKCSLARGAWLESLVRGYCLDDDLKKLEVARKAQEEERQFDEEKMTRGEGDRDLRAATKTEATLDFQIETIKEHYVMLLKRELDQSKLESETLREELRVRLRERLSGHEPTEKETRAAAAAGITLPDTAAVKLQKQRQQLESARKHAELRELADKVEKAEQRTKELMDKEDERQWREWVWQRRDDASVLKEETEADGLIQSTLPISEEE